jgi:hypothetical protein
VKAARHDTKATMGSYLVYQGQTLLGIMVSDVGRELHQVKRSWPKAVDVKIVPVGSVR